MKKYFAEREYTIEIEFNSLRSSFLRIYKQFFYENYFVKENFSWARYDDPELFLLRKLGLGNIWPFETRIETYDEATLFSVIEFLHEYVYSNTITGNYKCIEDGQKEYRTRVNDILRFYKGGYELSEDGEIQKLSPPGFEKLIDEVIETNDPENIDLRVNYAVSKFSRYNSSIEDKKDAVRTLADVLEYLRESLKEDGAYLFTEDDKNLRNIMNNFNIRHQNRSQHSDYDKDIWYDWVFYTFLASVHVSLKLNDKKFDLKTLHTE
jgi:hypothetical protein